MARQKGSQMVEWSKTRHTGVRYWESDTRKYRGRADKCYVIRYKRHGTTKSETVGWQSEGITPEFCSQLRGQITVNIKTGEGFQSLQEKRDIESARRRAEQSKAITLGKAFEDFKATRDLKKTTLREYERSMNTAFQDWKSRKVIDISRGAISDRHKKLKSDALKNYLQKCKEKGYKPTDKEKQARGGAQANLHMRFLRSLLNFFIGEYRDKCDKPLLTENPVRKLSETKAWNKVPRRKTIIKPDELPAWLKAVQELENENIRDYLLFLFLTGCRKEEALTLQIDQVDCKNRSYILIDTKNSEDITLPLSDYLFKLVNGRIKQLVGFKYLFPGTNKKRNLNPNAHLVEPKAQIQKVIEQSGVKFTLHDLRRRFITTADQLDLTGFAIKRLVNHSMGDSDVTSGYVVQDVERLRKPAQMIEDRLLSLAGVKKSGTVIKLKTG